MAKTLKPMSDTELARRKKRQALYSKTTSTAGLTALGLKGAQVAAMRHPATRRFSKPLSEAATTSAIIGSGVGGVGGYNFARYTAEDARRDRLRNKKVSKAMEGTSAFGVVHKSEHAEMRYVLRKIPKDKRRKQRARNAAVGAALSGGGSAALTAIANPRGVPIRNAALTAGAIGAGAGALLGANAQPSQYELARADGGKVKKAYDAEENRHRKTGAAIGAMGAGAGAATIGAVSQGRKSLRAVKASRANELAALKAMAGAKISRNPGAAATSMRSAKERAVPLLGEASKARVGAIKAGRNAALLGAGAAALGGGAVALDARSRKRGRTYRAWYDD